MSKELTILSTSGKKLGEIALNESVFGVEPNLHVMHLALRRQLNNARQGSACAKTRAEVAGGGENLGNKGVQVEQEQVLSDLHCSQAAELSLGQN